ELYEAVVRAAPDHAFGFRRLGDCKNRSVEIGAAVVAGEGASRRTERRLIVSCEIAADRGPASPFVCRFEQHVSAGVDRGWIVRRNHDRERPLERVFHVTGGATAGRFGPDRNVLRLACSMIVTGQKPVITTSVDDVSIAGIGRNIAGFSAANRVELVSIMC